MKTASDSFDDLFESPVPAGDLRTTSMRIDSGLTLPGETTLDIAVDIIAPDQPQPVVLVCLPGGGMNRRYFDLLPRDGNDSYSFARQMAQRGFISVLVDHLGVGDSSRPTDGYALTPEVLARANANVTTVVLDRLRQGMAVGGLPAMPDIQSIGVGHSMGALLTIVQQAQFRQHAGIVVLGFSTRGLPDYLSAKAKGLDIAGRRRELVQLARETFRESYPVLERGNDTTGLYAGKSAEPAGVEAIKSARDVLLPVPAFLSMLPDNVATEAAQIDVPVFVGLGERDLAGPPEDAPKAFTGSPSVTLEVLPGSGHSHFLFPARQQLFDSLAKQLGTHP